MSAAGSFAIVIATCNARDDLTGTLLAHCEQLQAAGIDDIDIIVADGASEDGTAERVGELARRYAFLKLMPQGTHFATTSQILEEALKAIDHAYVWPFGDADRPLPDAALRMRHALAEHGRDLVLANWRPVDDQTGRILPGRDSGRGPPEATSIADLAREFGFRSALAEASTVAFRRELFVAGEISHYRAISPRYGQAAAYLHAFAGARCAYLPEPLFDHRLEGGRAALRQPGHLAAADPIGIVRLFRDLRARGKIGRSLLFEIIEPRFTRKDHLWLELVQDVLTSVEQAVREGDARELPDPGELDELVHEFAIAAPDMGKLDCARRLAGLVEVARAGVQPFSASLALGEAAGASAANTLPYIRRLVDEQARSEIDGAIRAWIADESRTIQGYFRGSRS